MYQYLKQINYTPIQITDSMSSVAQQIIDMGILTKKSYDDCQHIAAAVIFGTCCNLKIMHIHFQKYCNIHLPLLQSGESIIQHLYFIIYYNTKYTGIGKLIKLLSKNNEKKIYKK